MKDVFIIAEAGVNHNGSLHLAKKLVDKAVEAKADAVKFQSFKAESLVTKTAEKAEYQKETTDSTESQFEMIKKLELTFSEQEELFNYTKEKGIMFLSSPFDLESADFLNKLGLEIFKIPSGEITNLPYLKRIASFKKEIILSTGMSTLEEIEDALQVLLQSGVDKARITMLHCSTEYPTPFENVHLNAMKTIKDNFKLNVGYSDHTEGIEVPIAAVALGARVIEKHFTLDKNMQGPDHKASLSPVELKNMVNALRKTQKVLGGPLKKPSKTELKNLLIARKSIVASKNIKKGEVFTEKNLTIKRPGNGISPMSWENLINKKATKDYVKDEQITNFLKTPLS
ncbi:N-acetylneuraminate synthase [Bacteriovoracales bacterium]|nr:N-acetylneuraminate synthase [Bacteriovoracales bacterium]